MEEALKSREYVQQYRIFLRRLRQARQGAGLTQEEVARRLSRPQSFISKCESGGRRVDFVELRYFARIYKKPISYFEPSKCVPAKHLPTRKPIRHLYSALINRNIGCTERFRPDFGFPAGRWLSTQR